MSGFNIISLKLKALKSLVRGQILKLLGQEAAGVFVKSPWGLMLVDPRDGHVSRQFLRTGRYNPEEVEHLCSILRPSDRLLIVGGHIGGIALPLSKHVQSVDVIEASPHNFQLLSANVCLSSCSNVTIHNWAASDKDGEIEFLMSSENSGGSKRTPAVQAANYIYDGPKTVKVLAHRLDDVFTGKFDAVLMDVEGSEYFAIQGAHRLLSTSRTFIFEFIPDHLRNVAGVGFREFFSILPLQHFSRAVLPRHNREVLITELEQELLALYNSSDYEDGVVLIAD